MSKTAPKFQGISYCQGHPERGGGSNGWSFPGPIERKLRKELKGLSCLHLFGGHATWGTRMDIDPITRPDVLGDAWLPPFGPEAFDAVILDPPYVDFGRDDLMSLCSTAAWISRKYVVWFAQAYLDSMPGCKLSKWWLVTIANGCPMRILAIFRVGDPEKKFQPPTRFRRGPAVKYNRWLAAPLGLPFPEHP